MRSHHFFHECRQPAGIFDRRAGRCFVRLAQHAFQQRLAGSARGLGLDRRLDRRRRRHRAAARLRQFLKNFGTLVDVVRMEIVQLAETQPDARQVQPNLHVGHRLFQVVAIHLPGTASRQGSAQTAIGPAAEISDDQNLKRCVGVGLFLDCLRHGLDIELD